MILAANKTKIVCTIGPASESPEIMERMIGAGMNVARLNFSHGDFSSHKKIIDNLRTASKAAGRRVAIMADLSGPKMRIGKFSQEPIDLKPGDAFTLTTEDIVGDTGRVSVSFARLPQVVKAGDKLFLNDGYLQLEVMRVEGNDVKCQVLVGGELRSRKGLNLPGVDLGISAFTDRDHDCLKFAMEQGVDAVSQSFVETASDINAVRDAAAALGHNPFIIAKIERSGALDHMESIFEAADGIMIARGEQGVDAVSQSFVETASDINAVRDAAAALGHNPFIIAKIERSGALDHMEGIFEAADGIMIARGDLGVEIPIEQIAIVQKRLMRQANELCKPVITATQMLESMTSNSRPTRAEATDVANAILDGTDCVMLSGESAMGEYPVAAVEMLAKIAASVEPHRSRYGLQDVLGTTGSDEDVSLTDLIALSVETTVDRISPAAVIVPTRSGDTARKISHFKLPVWITAVSSQESTCQRLQFSYGVCSVHQPDHPEDWKAFARDLLKSQGIKGNLVVLTEGPSLKHPDANNRIELIDLQAEK